MPWKDFRSVGAPPGDNGPVFFLFYFVFQVLSMFCRHERSRRPTNLCATTSPCFCFAELGAVYARKVLCRCVLLLDGDILQASLTGWTGFRPALYQRPLDARAKPLGRERRAWNSFTVDYQEFSRR